MDMDFGWALQQLREGRAVRRRVWLRYAEISSDEPSRLVLESPAPGWKPVLTGVTDDGVHCMYNPSHIQLLAEDWELAD